MKISSGELPGTLLVEPNVHRDERGYFLETWRAENYAAAGIGGHFVQDNLSSSRRGILRGLHFQKPNPQGKLVFVVEGEVVDVAVDIRLGSPNFGRWTSVRLSASNMRQFFIPEGFAHGFCVVSESAVVLYKCTDVYNSGAEFVLAWDDPDVGIDWPMEDPELSPKDSVGLRLKDLTPDQLVGYPGGE